MAHSQSLVRISGRIQTSGTRCVLQPSDHHQDVALIKCPGLGAALLRDMDGIRVTNGTPMIDVRCELTGRFLDVVVPPFNSVFGEITEITVYSETGAPIHVELSAIQKL